VVSAVVAELVIAPSQVHLLEKMEPQILVAVVAVHLPTTHLQLQVAARVAQDS
jgi:hypothetical protein